MEWKLSEAVGFSESAAVKDAFMVIKEVEVRISVPEQTALSVPWLGIETGYWCICLYKIEFPANAFLSCNP